jgi:hypothetical protein
MTNCGYPNHPEICPVAVVHRDPAVIHRGRQQEIVDIPLFFWQILPAGAGHLFEVAWAVL